MMAACLMKTSTLFVSNLPLDITSEQLESIFVNDGPIKRCFVVTEKGSKKGRGFGYVTFSLHEDSERAVGEKKVYKGRNLDIKYASKRVKPEEEDQKSNENKKREIAERRKIQKIAKHKKHRLIVRNLSFKASADNIKEYFSSYGNILDIHTPVTQDGKPKGFCFVQYEKVSSAVKAIKELNGHELKGRKIAIDWTVPKQQYLGQQSSGHKGRENVEEVAVSQSESSSDETKESAPIERGSNIQGKKHKDKLNNKSKKRKLDEKSDIPVSAGSDSVSDNSDIEASISDNEKDNSSEESDSSEEEMDTREEQMDINEDDTSDSDSEHDSGIEKSNSDKKKKIRKRDSPCDVEEGCTVFIRNIPFEATEDELEDCFEQWGEILYVILVTDKASSRPKGTAFLKFKSPDSAKSCVEECSNKPLVLDGRALQVMSALRTSEAKKLTVKEKPQEKDGRNLWLARIGVIRQGTEEAKGLSPADLIKRSKVESVKRQKMKNPNIFVSTTRLCVHNIPATVDNKTLKSMFLKAVSDKSAEISECRIMCDMKRVNSKGKPKSRGYAFIDFTKHQHALEALKNTNNNPEMFGDKKRLIVEFSLENRIALAAKEKRLERIKVKHAMLKGESKRATYNKIQKKKHQQKESVDEVVKPLQKGIRALPSHTGPKIRHKVRLKQKELSKNKVTMSATLKEKKKKKKNPPKMSGSSDAFDKLVSKYKDKLMPNIGSSKQRNAKSKWFQG